MTTETINHTEQAHQAHLLRAVEHAITYEGLTSPTGINLFPQHGWVILRFATGDESAVTDWASRVGAGLTHDGQSFERDGGGRWHEFGSRPTGKQGTLVGWRVDVWCTVDEPAPAEPDEDDPRTEQEYLFTFGAGQTFDGRFVRLFGTYEVARSRMNRVFGHAWCDQYDWRGFVAAGLPARMTELPRGEWPQHQRTSEDIACDAVGEDVIAAQAGVEFARPVGYASDIDQAERDALTARPELLRDWFFTFGFGHTLPDGTRLADRYVRMRDMTREDSRATMLAHFGNRWSNQYPSAVAAGVEEFGLELLPSAQWPDAQAGE